MYTCIRDGWVDRWHEYWARFVLVKYIIRSPIAIILRDYATVHETQFSVFIEKPRGVLSSYCNMNLSLFYSKTTLTIKTPLINSICLNWICFSFFFYFFIFLFEWTTYSSVSSEKMHIFGHHIVLNKNKLVW